MSERQAVLNHIAAVIPIEQALLGATMIEAGARVFPLTADEFAVGRHARIWEAILALHGRREPIVPVLVELELRNQGTVEEAGGSAEIALLTERAAILVNLPEYARLIREAYLERRRRQLGQDLSAEGFGLEEMERRIRELPGPLAPAIASPTKVWSGIKQGWSRPTITTGLNAIDQVALGLEPKDFMVIGARTSMGKSSFSIDLALRYARRGVRVEFFSLEDGTEQIARHLSLQAVRLPLAHRVVAWIFGNREPASRYAANAIRQFRALRCNGDVRKRTRQRPWFR
jgi:replicative DNA helicase